MNNMQIITQEAIASSYFTEDEVKTLIEEGKDIPFHTYTVWKSIGLVPKEGAHGWECRLWKKRNLKTTKNEEKAISGEENNFFLTKSFLFHISQRQSLNKIEIM